jgi:hypothetical protein
VNLEAQLPRREEGSGYYNNMSEDTNPFKGNVYDRSGREIDHANAGGKSGRMLRMAADTGSWRAGSRPQFSANAFGVLDENGGVSGSTFPSS